MFAKDDKKKVVSIIIAKKNNDKMKPSSDMEPDMSDKNEPNESEEPNHEGMSSAAEELVVALDNKDIPGIVAALKAFNEMC